MRVDAERAARFLGAGERVGHLEVVRPLGMGSMGDVYVARDLQLGRRVALKTLRVPERATEVRRQRFVRQLRRDAASTAQLNHPNIVTVHHFGEHRGRPFVVLELVEGSSLAAQLEERGALAEREMLRLGVRLCDALSYAHEHGVIHRDIKPANLMLTRGGELKVLDFGVALMRKAQEALEEQFGRPRDQLRELLGVARGVAGTPAYMAPEQLRGLEQDARVDVWAVGVTLFELCTGQLPFEEVAIGDAALEVVWPEQCSISAPTRRALAGCLRGPLEARTESLEVLGQQLRDALEELSVPVIEASAARVANLRMPMDAFVGRGEELELLDELVFERACPLVTVMGPGGVGKTRLVTEWGLQAHRAGRAERILECSLTEARTREGVLSAFAQALGLQAMVGDAAAHLGRVLERRGDMVLFVDNCEQVVGEVAELLSAWLHDAPNVQFVATSRTMLGVSGERVMQLDPLEDTLQAVELYTVRAREVRMGWECPPGQEQALEELVTQLDRLPLAIELAAAKARVLGPKKMLERMSQRFDVLATRKRGVSDRQATLRRAIEWSWELLTPVERLTLCQLGVFEGRFTLEAAEEVVFLDDQASFVLDVLEQLVSSSLLRADEDERFAMLVSVRAFVREELERSGLEDRVRARHAKWFGRWEFDDVERARFGDRLGFFSESDDMSAASSWGLSEGRSAEELEWGLRCLAGFAASVSWRGPFHASDELLERLERLEGVESSGMARAFGRLGGSVMRSGKMEVARELMERSIAMAHERGDGGVEVAGLTNLSILRRAQRDVAHSKELCDRALRLSRAIGSRRLESGALCNRGLIAWTEGDLESAQVYYEQSAQMAREVDNPWVEGLSMGNLGNLERSRGELDRAASLMARALSAARESGDRMSECVWLGNLGVVEMDRGELERAAALMNQAQELSRHIGNVRSEGVAEGNLGAIAQMRGDLDRAEASLTRAVVLSRQVGHPQNEAANLCRLGSLLREQGAITRARARVEEAMEIASSLGALELLLICHTELGRCALVEGDVMLAGEHHDSALELLAELGLLHTSQSGQGVMELGEALERATDDAPGE